MKAKHDDWLRFDLEHEVNRLVAAAAHGGIHAKHEAVAAMHISAHQFAAVLSGLERVFREARYGPEITEPLSAASAALLAQATESLVLARTALESLLNTSLGDLAASGRQVPNHSELNGGS